MGQVKPKDPQEVLSYTIDWSTWLAGGETISTSSWAADDLTVDSDTNDNTTTTVVVSAGTVAVAARVTNTITTSASRTGERSVIVRTDQR